MSRSLEFDLKMCVNTEVKIKTRPELNKRTNLETQWK
jgi:hypothetical protein